MCHAFQLLLHLRSINLNIGISKSAQSCYGSHCCPLPELNPSSWKVCDWYQVKRKPRQVFRLLHTNVLLPCKLMDVACVTSTTCVRPTLLYTLQVLLDHNVHVGYFHLFLQIVSRLAGVVWESQGVIQAMTGPELLRLAADCAKINWIWCSRIQRLTIVALWLKHRVVH